MNRNATSFINIEIEKNWMSKKHLGVNYGKDIHGLISIPISAYSTNTGFVSGTVWKPISIKVTRTGDNNKFQYFIVGVVDWKLLGATIYTQSKEFAGDVITK